MATNVMTGRSHAVSAKGTSWFQRYFLRRFHPRSIFIDVVGFIWFTYYFWNHNWKAAVVIVVIERIIAFFSVAKIDTNRFSETTLGKIALLHLHPANFTIQLYGGKIFQKVVYEKNESNGICQAG